MFRHRFTLALILGTLAAAVSFAGAIPPVTVHTVSLYVVEVDLDQAAEAKLDLNKNRTPEGIEAWLKSGAAVLRASPKISTVDGREAHFEAGGTDVRVLPTANGSGRVRLQCQCELTPQGELIGKPIQKFDSPREVGIATWYTFAELDAERRVEDRRQRTKTITLVRVDDSTKRHR